MNPEEFRWISGFLKERSGLALTEDKRYLVESRLKTLLRETGTDSLSGLITKLRNSSDENLRRAVVEAMTTNESMFFRDTKPFERLKQTVLPKLIPAHQGGTINIWSAACSNGQEPYSLAMMLEENKALLGGKNYRITATDLDTQVLKKAQEGVYTQFEVQRGLPIQMLLKYFEQKENNTWQVKSTLKTNITFRQHNLLDSSNPGSFDLIFCRNVLIYFDENDKRTVLERLASRMPGYGVLLLGSAETVIGLTDKLRPFPSESGMFIRSDCATYS